jgi:hypothetical protein
MKNEMAHIILIRSIALKDNLIPSLPNILENKIAYPTLNVNFKVLSITSCKTILMSIRSYKEYGIHQAKSS